MYLMSPLYEFINGIHTADYKILNLENRGPKKTNATYNSAAIN